MAADPDKQPLEFLEEKLDDALANFTASVEAMRQALHTPLCQANPEGTVAMVHSMFAISKNTRHSTENLTVFLMEEQLRNM
ncbi:gp031 [Rhodococcus phage ReqiDocB7]|uniref:gp031 n=1 Tax=Rhodococcus phage ReqiDocB7 TaxID=691966 RepID=UPI0001CDD761|nr:gp031 [Rhodococcus phage ReqiDocB7]ADD80817.1 gp031 [Rhodococcus phage ReqiDocB7]